MILPLPGVIRRDGMLELGVQDLGVARPRTQRGRMGMTVGLQSELPDELASFLGPDPAATVREAVLLQLVHEERMSVASAGQLLGLDRLDAIRWYTGHGYPYPSMTPAELQHDLDTLENVVGGRPA